MVCPGCGARCRGLPYVFRRQPVVLNYRFASTTEARRVPRRDVSLRQCRECGLVFNATFDPSVIPYDERYENRQCFSPAFTSHLEALGTDLVDRWQLRGRTVLEVGCGKGDFLRLIARLGDLSGSGYDTSYEGPPGDPGGRLQFFRRYVGPADVTGTVDLVLCRHVVEHVPEIGEFFRELAAIARAGGDPVVAIETPRFEWIVEQRCVWDVFYEHCNYFTMPTLARLARQAGFRVLRHRPVFGAQYQFLELRLARRPRALWPPVRLPKFGRLDLFRRTGHASLCSAAARVRKAAGRQPWAIWGAGAKGVALVNLWSGRAPACVIDSNAAKQGCVIPGSPVPVVAPTDPRLARLGAILVANPNYHAEIATALKGVGWTGALLSL